MKLRARGFEIVCGFVPEFVPNAYAKYAAGFSSKTVEADDQTGINWIVATANESERVGIEQTFYKII